MTTGLGLAGLFCTACLVASPLHAETIRIATYNVELTRDGPGLLLRDVRAGKDEQVRAITDVIERTNPHILALQGIDYDFGLEALSAFNMQLVAPFEHAFALPTNRGLQTGLDMDGNGTPGEAGDAQGYGRFYGQGAMALLSRYPIELDAVQDFTETLWIDLPIAELPRHADGSLFPSTSAMGVQRISSSGHWSVPIRIKNDLTLSVMLFHATPPVFDGPEDRNGLRNASEITLWTLMLDGKLGALPTGPFVIAGSATLDPFDSDGRNVVIQNMLNDPRLQDPTPESTGAFQAADQGHVGPNALDTVDWDGVGRLRADYVLPSADLVIENAGTFWPAEGAEGRSAALRASRHRLVWVDISLAD